MSSTSRGGKRSPADFYPTPAWPVHRLLERLPLPGGRWLEPAAGEGAIICSVNEWRAHYTNYVPVQWTAVEKRKSCMKTLRSIYSVHNALNGDFLKLHPSNNYNVCISNDPFSLAMDFITKTMPLAKWNIHLLRLNFLGTEERNEFFKSNMPDVYVIPDRVSFAQSVTCTSSVCLFAKMYPLHVKAPRKCPKCGAKTRVSSADSIEYAWFVWGPERGRRKGSIEVLDHTPLEQRR